jgi:hypothetical protein
MADVGLFDPKAAFINSLYPDVSGYDVGVAFARKL